MNVPSRLLAACAIAFGLGAASSLASAAPPGVEPAAGEQAVPGVELSADAVDPDELIDVIISGFTSRTVTVTVCGNGALRGSGDCNMAASESTRVNEDGSPRYVRLVVSPPPVPCPCLVRVSSPTNDQAAVAPITISGHPTATPVSGGAPDLTLVVSIRANRASDGLMDSIRASLGGPTAYDVTITIRNAATNAVAGIAISASAGRRQGHVLAVVDVVPPTSIPAGATWDGTVRVELPAPVWGEVLWSADVRAGDNSVEAGDETSSLPVLLITAIGVLLLVAVALSIRLVIRIRTRRRAGGAAGEQMERTQPDVEAPEVTWTAREFESV